MNKFFYYNPLCTGTNTPTVFANDPYVNAIKEMFVLELQQVAYYVQKLTDLNIDMSLYIDKIIEFISVLIVNLDFKKESFFVIIEDLYNNKVMIKKMYELKCNEMNITPELLKDDNENLSSKDIILKILNDEERNKDNKIPFKNVDKKKKSLYEIIICLVLNACNRLIELKSYDENLKEAKQAVIKLFNITNFLTLSEKELITAIDSFSEYGYLTIKELYKKINEKFGPIRKNQVSLLEKKGKAILVSGKSFIDIEKLLNAIEDKNINIYTHNGMIDAFQYEKLGNRKRLTGHYQKHNNNFSLDFAEFPGPIYITGNAIPKIDTIRGQIYTSAKYPSYGISTIYDDDFSEMINYAFEANGFNSDSDEEYLNIGFDIDEIINKIETISEKIKENEIKNIFIIGLLDKFCNSSEYINDFFNECKDDNYIISFAKNSERKNFWQVNSYYNYEILYIIIEKLIEKNPGINKHIGIFFPDCNYNTISHIFNLRYLSIKNIFLGPCCPNIINPLVTEGLEEMFNVNQITTPKKDISKIK